MKLSEAIVKGLKEISFTNATWLCFNKTMSKCDGCLVGAALHAQGYDESEDDILEQMARHWPWLNRLQVEKENILCPLCKEKVSVFYTDVISRVDYPFRVGRIGRMLTHLASHYSFNNECLSDIVDFVKRIEEKYEEKEVKEEPCEELIYQ